MRFVLSGAAALAALALGSCAFGINAPHIPEGPWCAMQDVGGGNVVNNCTLPSFEACRREVVAGNRGTCTRNPRWKGPPPA